MSWSNPGKVIRRSQVRRSAHYKRRRHGELLINYGDYFDHDGTIAEQPPVTSMTASWSSMGTI
jgi:hypothetical protein